jgi:hypothetical protein
VAVDDLKTGSAGGRVVVVIRCRGGTNGTLRFGGSCLVASGKRTEDDTDSGDTKSEAREVLRRHWGLRLGEPPMYGTRLS